MKKWVRRTNLLFGSENGRMKCRLKVHLFFPVVSTTFDDLTGLRGQIESMYLLAER
jgi:hypothetical protein